MESARLWPKTGTLPCHVQMKIKRTLTFIFSLLYFSFFYCLPRPREKQSFRIDGATVLKKVEIESFHFISFSFSNF